MSPALTLGALLLLLSNCAFSQTEEQNAYCSYVTQEAMAQRNEYWYAAADVLGHKQQSSEL
jgi:hypothetical protein